MKRILFFSLIALFLISCKSKQKEIDRLQLKTDSLMAITQLKDESVLDFIVSFNSIQSNLDSIKAVENIISINTQPGSEMNQSDQDRINDDIKSIHQLLIKNKRMVSDLRKKLRNSDNKNAALVKMIATLEAQIESKNKEIENLHLGLSKLNIKVESLNLKIEDLEVANQGQTKVIEGKISEMNTAWYAIGTKKELTDNKIIAKEGGVLGIGRTLKLNKDFDREYFTRIDITTLKYLSLMSKKANIISSHPGNSYRLSGEKKSDTLFIENYKDFWAASKYLVIVVE
ncbi:MAG: hypothetical protein Q7J34_05875 [Bacteroidales bacterium]|nr:hypothetical protein [Bacteroidales bacterium]